MSAIYEEKNNKGILLTTWGTAKLLGVWRLVDEDMPPEYSSPLVQAALFYDKLFVRMERYGRISEHRGYSELLKKGLIRIITSSEQEKIKETVPFYRKTPGLLTDRNYLLAVAKSIYGPHGDRSRVLSDKDTKVVAESQINDLIIAKMLKLPILAHKETTAFHYLFRKFQMADAPRNKRLEALKAAIEVIVPRFRIRTIDDLVEVRKDKLLVDFREGLERFCTNIASKPVTRDFKTQVKNEFDTLLKDAIFSMFKELEPYIYGRAKWKVSASIPLSIAAFAAKLIPMLEALTKAASLGKTIYEVHDVLEREKRLKKLRWILFTLRLDEHNIRHDLRTPSTLKEVEYSREYASRLLDDRRKVHEKQIIKIAQKYPRVIGELFEEMDEKDLKRLKDECKSIDFDCARIFGEYVKKYGAQRSFFSSEEWMGFFFQSMNDHVGYLMLYPVYKFLVETDVLKVWKDNKGQLLFARNEENIDKRKSRNIQARSSKRNPTL